MYNFHRKPLSTLLDLDELIFYCTEDKVKPILLEAINCYKAQAYRASILTCWIAVTVDAGFKINKLAELNCSEAKKLREEQQDIIKELNSGDDKKIKSAITKSTNFETDLSKNLLALNVINNIEQNYLNQLKDDRNLCGHPSYTDNYIDEIFQPSAEHARMHLRRVVDVLLSKNVVDDISDYISRNLDEHLWLDKSNSIEVLKKKGFEYLPDKQLKALINKLMWGFIDSNKKEEQLFHNKNVIYILKYFQEISASKVEPLVLKELKKIVNLAYESDKNNWLKFFLKFSNLYTRLEKENQEKIINNLNKSDLIITNKNVCKEIVGNDELEADIVNRIEDIEKLICLADANVHSNFKKNIYLDKFLKLQELDIHQQNINQLLKFYLVISNLSDVDVFLAKWKSQINLDDAICKLSEDEFEKYFDEIFKLKPDLIESKLKKFKEELIKYKFEYKDGSIKSSYRCSYSYLIQDKDKQDKDKYVKIILQKLLVNPNINQDLRKTVFDTCLWIYGLLNKYNSRDDFIEQFLKNLNLNDDEAGKIFYMTLCNKQLYNYSPNYSFVPSVIVEFLNNLFKKNLLKSNILLSEENLNHHFLEELKQQIRDIIIPNSSDDIKINEFIFSEHYYDEVKKSLTLDSNEQG